MSTIAIIGDLFMLPEIFQEKITSQAKKKFTIKTLQQSWPDQPMVHGYETKELNGLTEYFGTPHEIIDFVGHAEILITHLAPLTRDMLMHMPNLKFVAVARGGPTNIDIAAIRERNITLVNTPGRNATAVAEFTIGVIINESRLIRAGHESLRQGKWRGDLYRADRTGREINEMTVGVIGYGHVGSKVVKLLQAFNAKILVCDPYVQLSAEDHNAGVSHTSFEEILSKSDVITLHQRVTKETKGMMNADAFNRMRPGSFFVNTARGPLTDYGALYDALSSGHLSGAMLDTFAVEPVPSDWPLLKLPNVTLTPHIAGASVQTVHYAAEIIAQEIDRYIIGKNPLHPV